MPSNQTKYNWVEYGSSWTQRFKLGVPVVEKQSTAGQNLLLDDPSTLINLIDELCFLRDCSLLYNLRGSTAHMFHSFQCQEKEGLCMFDTGAINKNYISKKFFKTLSLPLHTTVERNAKLPNGQIMKVYGTSVLPLHLSEWHGNVQVNVIDLDADFDIILGLPWHKEHRPWIHWDTMIYEVEQKGKKCKIFPSSASKLIDIGKASLNVISERRANKALLTKKSEFALYYFRKIPQVPQSESADTIAPIVEGITSSEQQQVNNLLNEYKHVFSSSLPDGLPPPRGFEHEIETGDAPPVNIRAYPLSLQ